MLLTLAILVASIVPPEAEQLDNSAATELKGHIAWAIAHEGCPAYGAAPTQRADSILPASELRKCFLSVQRHNPIAYQMIAATSDQFLIQITSEAIELAKIQYQVRQNFEWTLVHEGQLGYFKALAEIGDFAAIRTQYRRLQNDNPNAINALNAYTDSELAATLSAQRISVAMKRPGQLDPAAARFIEARFEPSSTTLTEDTNVEDLAKQVYGSSASPYVDAIISSNRSALTDRPNREWGRSFEIKSGTNVIIPTLPAAGKVVTMSLRSEGTEIGRAVASALNSFSNLSSEVIQTGHIESPVKANLQSTTKTEFAEQGARWYLRAISADRVKPSDLAFLPAAVSAVAVIGVVDGGVDLNHPLIKPVLWPLTEELASSNWPKGSVGYDFYQDVPAPVEELENSHGTHVTGLVTGRQLAKWLPYFDDAGLSRNVEAFSLKVAGADGSFDFTAAQNAIEAGITKNIQIFNLSLFGPYSQLLQEDLARKDRVNSRIFIIAAGNDGKNLDGQQNKSMHRTFRNEDGTGLQSVIFVAALADNGKLADFSNYGKSVVQIAAPGVEISSTIHPSDFGPLSGTSQAAPLVTFAAAILKAENPGMQPPAIKNRLLNTCDFDDKLKEQVANGCKLNLLKTIVCGSDLVELRKDGTLIRGDISSKQPLFSGLSPNSSVVRVWISDSGTALYVFSSGQRQPRSVKNKSVIIKLHDGEKCPGRTVSGACTIKISDVQDVIFRVR
jgi:subtilisin family serine protease